MNLSMVFLYLYDVLDEYCVAYIIRLQHLFYYSIYLIKLVYFERHRRGVTINRY